jgi:hypothetical protein
VQKRYEDVGKQLFEGPNAVYALREILSDMLDDASLPPTYLLVDALDECVWPVRASAHYHRRQSWAAIAGQMAGDQP